MTDHEHEWRILLVMPNSATAQIRIRCRVSACNEVLLRQNAESILNEHAKLKRVRDAAEKLNSAVQAHYHQSGYMIAPYIGDAVGEMDDALEDTQEKE